MNADSGSLERHSPYEQMDLKDHLVKMTRLEDYEESQES